MTRDAISEDASVCFNHHPPGDGVLHLSAAAVRLKSYHRLRGMKPLVTKVHISFRVWARGRYNAPPFRPAPRTCPRRAGHSNDPTDRHLVPAFQSPTLVSASVTAAGTFNSCIARSTSAFSASALVRTSGVNSILMRRSEAPERSLVRTFVVPEPRASTSLMTCSWLQFSQGLEPSRSPGRFTVAVDFSSRESQTRLQPALDKAGSSAWSQLGHAAT